MAYNRVIEEGILPCKVTLAAACTVGQLLGYSTGWKLALATAAGVIEPELIAGQPGAIGDVITAYRGAVIYDADAPYTAGAIQWCGETGNGGAGETTETMPATQNDLDARLGVALDTSHVSLFLPFGGNTTRLHA